MNRDQLKSRYDRLLGKKEELINRIGDIKDELNARQKELDIIEKASAVLTMLVNDARQDFKADVDKLVTMAVQSVFSEDFSFDLQLASDSGKLQCRPVIWETIENEQIEYVPKEDMGGSILDPVGFALRIVLYRMQRNSLRPLFILDEPMQHVGHGELLVMAGSMLAELSHNLGLQLIIVTHEPELESIADRAYHVARSSAGVSHLRDLKSPKPPKPTKRKIIK